MGIDGCVLDFTTIICASMEVTYDYLWWFSGTGSLRLLFTRFLYFLCFSVRHAASWYISFVVCVIVQFFVFPMLSSLFLNELIELIHNIFWQFIPVFWYSNAEGVFSDVSVCFIIYHFLVLNLCSVSFIIVLLLYLLLDHNVPVLFCIPLSYLLLAVYMIVWVTQGFSSLEFVCCPFLYIFDHIYMFHFIWCPDWAGIV